ncbi:patatin-like phospholipase family protein [Brachyspira pulli]|uniref:patatin-like phospholipase family protein n=1 Tax=Brachyspira pulli TaxID=310721 RepID=UPI00300697D1
MEKLGLVLDGGGGKGAYQIGVWKYLKEVGLDNNIKAISGTSVGGLNACLFALNDYELAETLWTQKIQDKILSLDVEKEDIKVIFSQIMNILSIPHNTAIAIFNFLKTLVFKGVFSRKGLSDLIDEYIDLDAISKMYFPIYATCTEFPTFKTQYFQLNGKDKETIKKILLSTSAIPIIFPMQEINNIQDNIYKEGKKSYWDGGIKDNSPIKPLLNIGCTDIIVIHFDGKEILKYRKENVNIYEICPKEDLGNMITGVLDFSPEGAYRRIAQGYNDAKEILQVVVDIARAQAGIVKDLDIIRNHEKAFKQNRKQALEKRQKLKSNLNSTMESFMNIDENKKNYLEEQNKKNLE